MRKTHFGITSLLPAHDHEQLDAFLTLAQEGRFVSAARRLGVSQSGLSRQLQALERELGTKLLVRTPRGVVLTEAGQHYLVHAQRALDSLRRGASEVQEMAQTARGSVSLGTLVTVGAYLLPDLLVRFHKQHPEVLVRLVEGKAEELEERVAKGELDLAVLNLPVRRVDLVAQKLWTEDFILAVPRGHKLAQAKGPVPLAGGAGRAFGGGARGGGHARPGSGGGGRRGAAQHCPGNRQPRRHAAHGGAGLGPVADAVADGARADGPRL